MCRGSSQLAPPPKKKKKKKIHDRTTPDGSSLQHAFANGSVSSFNRLISTCRLLGRSRGLQAGDMRKSLSVWNLCHLHFSNFTGEAENYLCVKQNAYLF